MSNKDYGEVLLQSTEQIVDSKLSTVKFDQTIICTITDDSNAFNGEYQVSDGSVTFTAYSENKNYIKNMQVYVLIPQGNWANKKQITALYSKSESAIINYVSELEKLMVVESIQVDEQTIEDFAAGGLVYSDDENLPPMVGSIPSGAVDLEDYYNTDLVNTLYLGFNIQTQKLSIDILEDYQFGIKITIYPRSSENSTPNEEESISFSYTNNQMLGNPFYYFTPVWQEIVFPIDSKLISQIGRIELELLRDEDPTDIENNIALMDIKITGIDIALCHDVSQYENNTVLLFPTESADNTYEGDDEVNSTTKLSIIWVNKDKYGRYLGFTDGEFNKNNAQFFELDLNSEKIYYWIEWYQDTPYKRLELINHEEKQEIYELQLLSKFIDTGVKAKIYKNGKSYESTVLTFKNISSTAMIEETLKRLNGGDILNCVGEYNPNHGGQGQAYCCYPSFTVGPNQGKGIQFTKKMQINKNILESAQEGLIEDENGNVTSEIINFTYDIVYHSGGGDSIPGSKNSVNYQLIDGKVLYLESHSNLLDGYDAQDYHIENPKFNNISSLCLKSLSPAEVSDKTYIINEIDLNKRLAEAEARIQQLERQLSAYI